MAASCWRRKNSFCCLARDSSTVEATLVETSEMDVSLMNREVTCFIRADTVGVERWAVWLWSVNCRDYMRLG